MNEKPAIKIDRMELADIGSPVSLAQAILKQLSPATFPVPVDEIALGSDILEIKEHTSEGFEGALITDANKSAGYILVKHGAPPERRRFTIAHELGHWHNGWHKPVGQGFECSKDDFRQRSVSKEKGRQQMETEANRFAAELLMPIRDFRKRMGAGGATLESTMSLDRTFGVSKAAIARRLVDADENCALVASHLDRIQYIVKGDQFPWLMLRKGQPLPKTISARHAAGLSSQDEVDPCHWLQKSLGENATLYEQVLVQGYGYKLTLLSLDESACEDDDEAEASERSVFNPRFR